MLVEVLERKSLVYRSGVVDDSEIVFLRICIDIPIGSRESGVINSPLRRNLPVEDRCTRRDALDRKRNILLVNL